MKRIFDIFKTHRHALIWTACYVCVMWLILKTMFNFDLFSAYQWHRLLNAQLHGFAGFVFGILILAAAPLYVATTTLIIRKKQPLVTIPKPKLPQCMKRPAPEPEKKEEEPKPEPKPERTDIPLELRSAFARARHRIAIMPAQATNNSTQQSATQPAPTDNTEILPLPTDFDINLDFDDSDETAAPSFSAPVFSEVTFAPTPTSAPEVDENILADILNESNSDSKPDISRITQHLTESGILFDTDQDNIIITPEYAIATHSDNDFWVADNENWFAAGKVCKSPIFAAQQAAQKHGRKPVVCLLATNIMELDNNIKTWESAGIKIITDPSEL